MAAEQHAIDIALVAAQAAADKKAENINIRDVSEPLAISEIFVMVSASSERQVGAIVDGVEEALIKLRDERPRRREGKGENQWVLLDYADMVVHVFDEEARDFYSLDSLWKDCPQIDFVDGESPSLLRPEGVTAVSTDVSADGSESADETAAE